MSLTSIQEEIVRLSSAERAMLIDILWKSLDEAPVREIEARWSAESEERIDAVARGELQTVEDRLPLEIFVRLCGNDAIPLYLRRASRAAASDTLLRATRKRFGNGIPERN